MGRSFTSYSCSGAGPASCTKTRKRSSRPAIASISARASSITFSTIPVTWSTWKSSARWISRPPTPSGPARCPSPLRGSRLPRRASGEPGSDALELHVELVDLVGLSSCRGDPFGHLRHPHDFRGVRRAGLVELDLVAREAGDDRSVHRVGHRPLAEQVRTAVTL